jgi:hypothetical protein
MVLLDTGKAEERDPRRKGCGKSEEIRDISYIGSHKAKMLQENEKEKKNIIMARNFTTITK